MQLNLRTVLVLALPMTGCLVELTVPPGQVVTCNTSADCIDDAPCVNNVCFAGEIDDLDLVAPQLIDAIADESTLLYGLTPSDDLRAVLVTLCVDEELASSSTLVLSGGGIEAEFESFQPTATCPDPDPETTEFAYTARYEPTGNEEEGINFALTAQLVDDLANRNELLLPFRLSFDHLRPAVVRDTGREPSKSIRPDPSNPLFAEIINDPAGAAVGTTSDLLIAFEVSELVNDVVVSTVSPSHLVFTETSRAGTAYVFTLDWTATTAAANLAGVSADGTYALQVSFVDGAGNTIDSNDTSLALDVRVDTTPPAAPVTANRGITLRRSLWGDEGAPERTRFTLQGVAGSVEADARVIAYLDESSFATLGQTDADTTGAFGGAAGTDFELATANVDLAWIQIFDAAGNASDADPASPGSQRTRVDQASTVVTLGRKVAGDGLANPNSLHFRAGLSELLTVSGDTELDAADGVAEPGVPGHNGTGAGRWQRMVSPGGATADAVGIALGIDPTTGRALTYGGKSTTTVPGPDVDICDADLALSYQRDDWKQDWRVATYSNAGPGPMSDGRFIYFAPQERLILIGGSSSGGTLGMWTVEADAWVEVCDDAECRGSAPGPMTNMVAVYDATRRVLVVHNGSTWEWDGELWSQPCSTAPCSDAVPGHIAGAGATYDSALGEVLIFGGTAGDETWSFDGNRWLQHCTDTGCTPPPAREETAMVFDAKRGYTLLYGGSPAGDACNPFTPISFRGVTLEDTWKFENGTWTQLSPATQPGKRFRHAMAYDPVTSEVLLVGGTECNCTNSFLYDPQRETWRWDGGDWRKIGLSGMTAAPAATTAARLAYHPSIQQTVMYHSGASAANGSAIATTYSWSGTRWFEYFVGPNAATPSDRRYAGFAAASENSDPFLIGGNDCCVLGVTDDVRELRHSGNNADWQAALAAGACGPDGCPEARLGASAAGDALGIVLFGGAAVTGPPCGEPSDVFCYLRNDTWYYDALAATWAPVTATGPSARILSGMAPTGIPGETLLFGGATSFGNSGDDTWLFDSTSGSWTLADPATVPDRRADHGLAYDPTRGAVTMVGGARLASKHGSDPDHIIDDVYALVWEWSGTDWSVAPVTDPEGDGQPAPRRGPALHADPNTDSLLMFGGARSGRFPQDGIYGDNLNSATIDDETWLWRAQSDLRPGYIFTVQTFSIGTDNLALEGITLRFDGSASAMDGNGVPTTDLDILLWYGDRWLTVAGVQQGSTTTWDSDDDPFFASTPARLAGMLGPTRQIRVALAPAGVNGPAGHWATIAADYVSAELRYTITD